ncbi:MAG: protein kinase [Actinobacteria bacterium]|nr:protein kinase [Actinomycetota bacterium]
MSWVPRIGSEFAGYRLESLIGHGGMSIVYRAEHLSLGRTVALKLLAPQLSEDQGFRDRFTQESRLAASLDHPNIIPIYEAGEEGEVFWIAMRYVAGSDAKNLLKREGPLDPERVADIIVPVASALGAAHGKGLVHRDVKPANILLASGEGMEDESHVYLSDFGVAKHTASRALTKTGIFVGTAEYASPEQIEGKPLDGRADVYSLGCVLYECLTGAPAYDRDSEVALMYAHLLEPPPSVTATRPDLPAEIDELIAKAMAKSRDDRFATAREFATEARSVLGRGGHAATSAAVHTARPPSQETVLAAPTQHPSLDATPPPASNGAGRDSGSPPDWRRWAIVLGGAAVIALAAIPGIILLAGDEDTAAGTQTTTQTAGTTTEPAAPTSLLEVLTPTQITRGCTKSANPVPGAVETDTCTPTEGAPTSHPNEFELSFFGDALPLEESYKQEKDALDEQTCGGIAGERVWIHLATGKRGGRRFCGVDSGGRFVIVWTHEKLDAPDHVDMLGIAREPGRSPTTFTSWWAAVNDNIGKCRPKVAEETCLQTIETIANR